jgi:SWI/SNF-related matrix-associated actin-dependent regulator 1 of chromatin subfamily A
MPTALLTILLTIVNGKLRANPRDRLNGSFGSYLDATKVAGMSFNRSERCQEGDPRRIADVVEALTETGHFRVQLGAGTQDTVRAMLDEMGTPGGHLAELCEELAERGLSPRPYQVTGIEYLAGQDRALLFDDMGLGKTIQVLLALPRDARAVLVVPAQVKGNWARECRTWRPDLTPTMLSGRKSFRWPDAGEVVITNYEILSKGEDLAAAPDGVIVVADEAHKVKNNKAARTKNFRSLGAKARKAGGATWLLTGTPMLNRPGELWNVLQGADLAKRAFGSYDRFMEVFNGERGTWGIEWGRLGPEDDYDDFGRCLVKSWDEALACLAKVGLGRRKDVVAKDLPSKVFQTVEVESKGAASKLKALWADFEKAGFTLVDGEMLNPAGDPATLEDITGDKLLFERISNVRKVVATAKVPALVKLVEDYEENGEPLVVFSAHKAPVEELAKRDGWATITGDHTAEQKTATVEAFQAGKLKGVACTNAAIEGITLTHASHMIFVDRFWTPGLNAQAEDRIHRIGQERTCFYTDLVIDHPMDSLVHGLLAVKRDHVETIHQATFNPAPDSLYARLTRVLELDEDAPAQDDDDAQMSAGERWCRANNLTYNVVPATTDDAPEETEPEFEALLRIFRAVKAKGAKMPRIAILGANGEKLLLKYINVGVNDGGVNVASEDGSVWYGRISRSGYAHRSFEEKGGRDIAGDAIKLFVADPSAYARDVYGKKTACCMFCLRAFDRLYSAQMGYGPKCAENYDLPWDSVEYAKAEQLPHVKVNVKLDAAAGRS